MAGRYRAGARLKRSSRADTVQSMTKPAYRAILPIICFGLSFFRFFIGVIRQNESCPNRAI